MAQKKKRLTQREKAERAALKKKFQAEGLIPPDKPRLNRGEVCPGDLGGVRVVLHIRAHPGGALAH